MCFTLLVVKIVLQTNYLVSCVAQQQTEEKHNNKDKKMNAKHLDQKIVYKQNYGNLRF
jgi:hypothetical protein